MKKAGAALVIVLMLMVIMAGCTIKNGVFLGFNDEATDTSLSASYVSFDGSIAKRLSLKADDQVHFNFEGGEGLCAVVIKDSKELCEIADDTTFEAAADGTYDFAVKGTAKKGAFSLSWSVE